MMTDQDENAGRPKASRLEKFHGKAVIIFSFAAAVWAGLTGVLDYASDLRASGERERQAQAEAVAKVSRVLGVMRFNCDKGFGPLVRLADTVDSGHTRQKKVCHEAFLELSSLIYQAPIQIKRPDDIAEEDWKTYWTSFSDGITRIAANDYDAARVDCPWKNIARSTNALFHGTACP